MVGDHSDYGKRQQKKTCSSNGSREQIGTEREVVSRVRYILQRTVLVMHIPQPSPEF